MKKNLRLFYILIVLAIAAGVMWYIKGENGPITNNPLANFAIEDTASITKIFIIDTKQESVLLERSENSRYWTLNGKLLARKDATDLLLKTFKRIKVKEPVSKKMRENVIRVLAGTGKKVEIYQGGDNPSKIYYVGTPTQDHTGTFMLLETPEKGRSSEPFVTHMEGFSGFLSTRFFTDEEEWRYTGIFDYPKLDIKQVEVIHHLNPERSFRVELNEDSLSLYSSLLQRKVKQFDTLKLRDYMLLYKKVHLETYQSHLSEAAEDSLVNSDPAFTLRVTENTGKTKKVDLYWKSASTQYIDENGMVLPWDGSRMYGVVNKGDVVLVQRFVFDPLLQGIEQFVVRP
jgi:hypothetical protein